MQRDFPEYAWSLRTLDRRLRYFNIYNKDKNISVEEVQLVVLEEISEPGSLLGYHAMHAKIRQYRQLNVPRALVYAAMEDADPNGLEHRTVGKKAKEKKEVLHLKGLIECFPLMVMISSWAFRTVPSRWQYTVV